MGRIHPLFLLIISLSLLCPFALAQNTSGPYPIRVGAVNPAGAMEAIETGFDRTVLKVQAHSSKARIVENADGVFLEFDCFSGSTTEVGKPALPTEHGFVDLPFGAHDIRVKIEKETWEEVDLHTLAGAAYVLPVQPPRSKSAAPGEEPALAMNRTFYHQDRFYPEASVELGEAGFLRGHRLLDVTLHPVRYNPATGTLRVLKNMTFTIIHEGGDLETTRRMHQRYESHVFEDTLRNMTANYGFMAATYAPHPALPIGYLVITHPDFAAGIQALADWKEHMGYHTTVATTAETGNTTTLIKNYIQNAYDTWSVPPTFVLLVGDTNYIPSFSSTAASSVTDLYYTTLEGADYFPDIHLGRFSVTNGTQLQNVLDKVLGYEQVDWAYTAWIKKAAFMASVDNYQISEGTHNYVIDHYLVPNGYTCDKLYQVTYGADTQDVRDSLNDGRSLAVYSGHGSQTSWADGPPFSQNDVNNLTNLDMYPFVCSHACLTGDFAISECFAETWQRAAGKGGLAFWGASDSTYWDEDDILEKAMFQAAFSDGLYYLGGMTDQALIYLYDYYSGGGKTLYYFECYNVLGDPSLLVHTEEPQALTVTHETALPIGAAPLNVSVSLGGGPVEGALVHAAKDGEVFASAYTDATGAAVLNITTVTPGAMDLVVTAHNGIPYETSIIIFVPSGPYVVLDDYTVGDSAGDNDGLIDIGESIDLPVAGKNVGTVTSFGVTAALTSLDPLVTITDGDEILGDIASDATVWSADDFDFDVSPFCEDGHIIPFTVTFTDMDLNVWDYGLNLLVNAPKLAYQSFTLDDSAGNGDGFADPGESITFDVVVLNDGHETARDVSVELHTLDTQCAVTQGSAAYADLDPGISGTNLTPLAATIDNDCPVGHQVVIDVDLYRGGSLVGSDQFSFIVSRIPVLIIDLDGNHNSAPDMEATLASLGVTYEKTTTWPSDMSLYQSLFICLGIFSDNTALSTSQGNALVAFLQNGGMAYMEGGECWAYDSAAGVYLESFGINGDADGTGDTEFIAGQAGTIADGLIFSYDGDNSYMDHISARAGASLIFRNQSPSYGNGVSYDSGVHRTIGVSFEFGGLENGVGGHQIDWMTAIVQFFGLPQEFQPLYASASTLSVRTGGTIHFYLNAGSENGGRWYLMLGSMSGSVPGIPLPNGGETLPINWDSFTDFVLDHLNGPVFVDFLSVLNAEGEAAARLVAPTLNSNKIGKVMTYAYCLEGTPDWDFVSNPVEILFVQ